MCKKILSGVLAFAMMLSIAGCSVDTDVASTEFVSTNENAGEVTEIIDIEEELVPAVDLETAEILSDVKTEEPKEGESEMESKEEVSVDTEEKKEVKTEAEIKEKELTQSEEKEAESEEVETKEEEAESEVEEPAEEEKAESKAEESVVNQGLPKAEDMIWTDVGEREMYVTSVAAVRTGPNIGYEKLDSKAVGEKVIQLEEGSGSWSKVQWNDQVAYMYTPYLSDKEPPKPVDTSAYPIVYEDDTSKITIYREWYGNAWVYAAHVEFTDYERLYTVCGNDTYGGFETTLSAARRHNAILAINGCYSAPYLGYKVCRRGVIYNDGTNWNPGVYSSKTGEFHLSWEAGRGEKGYAGVSLSKLVKEGKVTDTFCFGPPGLVDGKNLCNANDTGRAQRTFIGSDGSKGDMWLCVSDGRFNDGVSAGLNGYQCMQYLKDKGCTKGINLDGGGSTTMVFQGQVLNAARGNLRAVVDHLIFE